MWVQSRWWCGMDRQRRAQRVGKRPRRKVRRAGGDADAECAVAPPRECTGCRAVIRRAQGPAHSVRRACQLTGSSPRASKTARRDGAELEHRLSGSELYLVHCGGARFCRFRFCRFKAHLAV